MSKICSICGKKPQIGHQVSHAHKASKRRFYPNVHKTKISTDSGAKSAYVCTRCLRSGKVTKVL
ncbi:MAG: 50S ribosomal protein L28 [candidate division KSB1 bacterium]|nr:50S ribosomal protein L28 [candidate division KSB1 bacterium]